MPAQCLLNRHRERDNPVDLTGQRSQPTGRKKLGQTCDLYRNPAFGLKMPLHDGQLAHSGRSDDAVGQPERQTIFILV